MRLALYRVIGPIRNEGGAHQQAPSRVAWMMPSGALLDVQGTYEQYCREFSKFHRDERANAIQSVLQLIFYHEVEGWGWLQTLYDFATQGLSDGSFDASSILYQNDQVQLLLPFVPQSFRDFYAFESHVKTCRARRGLDMVSEWYEFPVFYFSNPRAFRGPDDVVSHPNYSKELDFELEVACVVGRTGSSITRQDAHEYIAGYLVLNDWSLRDIQREEVKVGLGPAKGKDFATSMGPVLVTPDELADVAAASADGIRHKLRMTAKVNGRVISEGRLEDLHYTFGQMIERASQGVTLYPGEVIGSGTVGSGCILELGTDIQAWLQPGDVVELEVERLGTLRNQIV